MRGTSIREYKPTISGTLTMSDGNTISLVNGDFVANSLAVRSSTSSGGVFNLGGVNIGAIDFTLINDSGKFDNMDWYDSKVELELHANNEVISFGDYLIVGHRETGRLISVQAHDILAVLDRFKLGGDGQPQSYEFPMTVQAALDGIPNWTLVSGGTRTLYDEYGLTIDYTRISAAMLATVIPDPGIVTLRGLMSYIAQICGKFVRARGTELIFDWYNKTTSYNAGTTFSHELDTDNCYFSKVIVQGPTSYPWAMTVRINHTATMTGYSQNYRLTGDENPLLTDTNYGDVSDALVEALKDLNFRPGSAGIVSDAALEAGDAILISTGQEQNIPFLIATTTYKPQLIQSVSSDSIRDAGDLRPVGNDYIHQVAQETVESAMSGVGGGYTSVEFGSDVGIFGTSNGARVNVIDMGVKEQGTDTITGGTPTLLQLPNNQYRLQWGINQNSSERCPPVAVPTLESVKASIVADGKLAADAQESAFWAYTPDYGFDVPVTIMLRAVPNSGVTPTGDTYWLVCYRYKGWWSGTDQITLDTSRFVWSQCLSMSSGGGWRYELVSQYMPRPTSGQDMSGGATGYIRKNPADAKWYFGGEFPVQV